MSGPTIRLTRTGTDVLFESIGTRGNLASSRTIKHDSIDEARAYCAGVRRRNARVEELPEVDL